MNRYHSALCTTYQDSSSYVSIFLVSGKREGKERERETFSALLFSVFPSRVYCHVIPHRVLFSYKNWRELYKNLTVLSSLDA